MTLKQRISQNLKRLRREQGLSQQKLANATGLQIRYLSQIENHPKDISTRTLERLATGLGVQVSALTENPSGKVQTASLPAKYAAGMDEAIKILKSHRTRIK